MVLFTALLNASENLGCFLGPLFGAALYTNLGYSGPFIVFAGCSVPALIALVAYCRYDLSKASSQPKAGSSPSFSSLLRIPSVSIVLVEFVGSMMTFISLETTLPTALTLEFGFTSDKVALYLAILMGVRPFLSLLLMLIPENFEMRYLLIPAQFVAFVGCLLAGPSTTFSLP